MPDMRAAAHGGRPREMNSSAKNGFVRVAGQAFPVVLVEPSMTVRFQRKALIVVWTVIAF